MRWTVLFLVRIGAWNESSRLRVKFCLAGVWYEQREEEACSGQGSFDDMKQSPTQTSSGGVNSNGVYYKDAGTGCSRIQNPPPSPPHPEKKKKKRK